MARRSPRTMLVAGVARLADGADVDELNTIAADLEEKDVVAIATSKHANREVILALCHTAEFTKSYAVKLALVRDRHTPFPLVARWLPLLRQTDLRTLAVQPCLPRGGGGNGGGGGAALVHVAVAGK